MKYCINYTEHRHFKYMKEVDELEYNYKREDVHLLDFLNNFSTKRLIIRLNEDILEEDVKRFAKIREEFPGVQIAFSLPAFNDYTSRGLFNELKNMGYEVFFHSLCNNWETLNVMKDMGVSDIYLVEQMGFEIAAAAAILHPLNINIRTFPNICQTTVNTGDIDPIRTFFIRPEDIDAYEDYIDVLEFFNAEKNIETYYKVYAKQGYWYGTLDELIINFNNPIDSRALPTVFGSKRVNCGRRCLKGKTCMLCDRLVELSDTMIAHDMAFSHPKKH